MFERDTLKEEMCSVWREESIVIFELQSYDSGWFTVVDFGITIIELSEFPRPQA
jgi:hypothetical protein